MNKQQRHGVLAALFSTLVLLSAAPAALANPDPATGDDWRPGMMGPGYGPGMMGPGHGPGMMGPGMGMMGPGGPGMMDGCGPGMGMGGMGMGGMGMMPMHMLDLSTEQRKQYNAVTTDLHRQNWTRMGRMMELSQQLNELYLAEPPDPKAIGKTYGEISDLQRQMMEARVVAHNKLNGLLSDEQRERMRDLCRGGRGGMHRGMMGN